MTKWCSFSHVKLQTLPEPQQSELVTQYKYHTVAIY